MYYTFHKPSTKVKQRIYYFILQNFSNQRLSFYYDMQTLNWSQRTYKNVCLRKRCLCESILSGPGLLEKCLIIEYKKSFLFTDKWLQMADIIISYNVSINWNTCAENHAKKEQF